MKIKEEKMKPIQLGKHNLNNILNTSVFMVIYTTDSGFSFITFERITTEVQNTKILDCYSSVIDDNYMCFGLRQITGLEE